VPFGVADELVSTLDFATAAQTLSIYASLVGHHWLRPHADGSESSLVRRAVGGLLSYVGPTVTRMLRPPEPYDDIPSDNP
jgi:hypothetical protein